MTKRLEELFDLPTGEDETPEQELQEDIAENQLTPAEITTETMSNLEKIDSALPAIKGLESSDDEMDEIAKLALKSYQDLMDLGMNVEARLASEILGSASNFLGHAITARNAKINKKLRMVDLLLRKAKLDHERGEADETATGEIVDRNQLLKEILAQSQDAEVSDTDDKNE